tara:strand:- start:365 stop:607 length:243 start_codon:yes stop_codon:yes gene_type:complete
MYGINAKLPKEFFSCEMCSGPSRQQSPYIYGSFAIPPKHPYVEMKICKACALREHGNKNKRKLEDIINERTEKWLKQKKK